MWLYIFFYFIISSEVPEQQQPPEEPQPQEMTLDEWKALQTQHKPKAEFNIRQPGEGEDGSKWSKGREYHKKHEDEEEEEEESEEEEEDEVYFVSLLCWSYFQFSLVLIKEKKVAPFRASG